MQSSLLLNQVGTLHLVNITGLQYLSNDFIYLQCWQSVITGACESLKVINWYQHVESSIVFVLSIRFMKHDFKCVHRGISGYISKLW
jgi:hypothetical protein